MATTYGRVGDVLAEQDRSQEAVKFYRASLAIVEQLAKADPGEALWLRESSATYNKVGDILVEQRNLPDALKSYQTSLVIAERWPKSIRAAPVGGASWRRPTTRSAICSWSSAICRTH
jgi:predicted negative regulator of RcsB-dependent stress response